VNAQHLVNLLAFLVVILGHLLLIRGVIARLYRYAMPWALWLGAWFVMVSVGVVVPWVLVQRVGLHGPRVLRGGSWTRAPVGWQLYALVSVAAFVVSNVRRYFPRRPRALISARGRTVDVAARIGTRPATQGVRRWLARTPGNELFHVEISERELALPGLPAALDGLSILHLTDLHLNGTPGREFFEHALELARPLRPDLVALTGDILDRHAMKHWLPTTLGRLDAPLGCYFVLGNHDALDEPETIRAAMTGLGWVDVGGRSVTGRMPGGAIVVAGTERPWLGAHPAAPDVGASAALRLLLSHTPEQFAWGADAGFDLVLAGHLHGGQIDLPLLGPISGGRYHAGVFSSGRTVMHVSRGLGAMFPFRWNCPAEITKLVLRRAGDQASSAAVGRIRRR
jgi:predicted MPP superfamily phosphohydrolase